MKLCSPFFPPILAYILPISSCFTIHSLKFHTSKKTPDRLHRSTFLSPSASRFLPIQPMTQFSRNVQCNDESTSLYTSTRLQQSQEGSDSEKTPSETPKKRKRTRRKVDSKLVAEPEKEKQVSGEMKAKGEKEMKTISGSTANQFVEMEVPNIRSMMSGEANVLDSEYDDDYEEEDDDGDSLKTLLEDAKRMRSTKGTDADEDEFNVGPVIKNVISTIVTVDFFIVLALLAWFLLGIFSSSVLKNDAIQIAFNGIFEPVVQPALGVLMIAAAAGGAMGGDENKD